MASRPTSYLNWTNGAPPNVIQPPANFLAAGWQPGQAPPAEYMNWLFYETDQWIQFFDESIETGIPDSVIRLLNGGIFSFSASTGVLAWSATANLAIPSIADSSNAIAAGSVTLSDGEVAYTTANTPIVAQGNGTSGSNVLTNVNFTSNIADGYTCTGPGVPSGTTVTGVGTNTVTLSQNLTATTTTGTFVFAASGPLTVSVLPSTSLIPTINTVLIARRSGNIIYLGVNAVQMVLRDGEFKALSGSGYFSVYQGVAGQTLSAGELVYASPGSADAGRTAGEFYPLDVSAANQAVRGTYAGVNITAATAGQAITILYEGFYSYAGLTAGQNYYADPANPGGITATQPAGAGEKIVGIGYAINSSEILFAGNGTGGTYLSTYPIFANDPPVTANGSTAAFNLVSVPLNAGSVLPFIDGVYQDPSLWTFSGSQTVTFSTTPAKAQVITFRYVLALQNYIGCFSQFLGIANGSTTTYALTGIPLNAASTLVFVDGVETDSDDAENPWSLTIGATSASLVFMTAPAAGQRISVVYFTSSTGSASGVSNAANLGSGVGLFNALSSGILQFKSLIAGTNVTITDNHDGTVTIAATGGGGGGSIDAHGSGASPITSVSSSIGFIPATTNDQVWWIQPMSGAGAVSFTSTPQVQAGVTVGQRLTIKGTSASDYFIFDDGNGLSLNGPCSLTDNQALMLIWNGTVWDEISRRA